ncbi:MAG: hypothetical protein PUE01_10685 [Clostridiaceae bacterium]|nr:hypothetical protein [Clostridiaceae bacterium]
MVKFGKKVIVILNIVAAVLIYIIFVPVDSNSGAEESGDIKLGVSYSASTGPCIYVEDGKPELEKMAAEYGDLDCTWISTQGDLPYNKVVDPASVGKCTLIGKVIGVGEEKSPLFKVSHYKINRFNQDKYLLESLFTIVLLFYTAIFDLVFFGEIIIRKISKR